jgi:hypothetical protein
MNKTDNKVIRYTKNDRVVFWCLEDEAKGTKTYHLSFIEGRIHYKYASPCIYFKRIENIKNAELINPADIYKSTIPLRDVIRIYPNLGKALNDTKEFFNRWRVTKEYIDKYTKEFEAYSENFIKGKKRSLIK